MGLCVLYYVGYSMYNVEKVGFFYLGWNCTLTHSHTTKFWTRPKLKAFADDKLNVTKMIISVFDRVENIVGKGEIACTNNSSFSHNVFKRRLSQRHQKVSLCGNGLTSNVDVFLSDAVLNKF